MIIGGFIFILGLIIGSFLNAWEYRIENKMTLGGRSICPKCKKQIAWYDNIPLISWLLLISRCRHCHKPISIQYPLIELVTGLTFLGLWLYSAPGLALNNYLNSYLYSQSLTFHLSPLTLFQLLLLSTSYTLLLLVALYDAKTKYVISKYVYIAAGLGVVINILYFNKVPGWFDIYPYLLAVLVPTGILWLIARITKEKAMGYGDSEIALALGCILGWPKIMPAYYFAFIAGSLYGIYVLAVKKGNLKSEVPLGPFLVSGAIFGITFGQQIVDWYVKIVLGM